MKTTPEASLSPNPRPWQFGLRELFLTFVALSVLCAAASWSIFSAIFLLGWALCVSQAIWYRRKYPGQKFWKKSAMLIALVVLLLMCFGIPKMQSIGTKSQGELDFRVIDARDQAPVEDALVELFPNGDPFGSTFGLTNSAGVANLTGTFQASQHAGGWGRMSTTLYFRDTYLDITANGYEARSIPWEELSPDAYRSADAPRNPPLVIELRPSTKAAQATP